MMDTMVANLWPAGWQAVLAGYETALQELEPAGRGEFTDDFFAACLRRVDPAAGGPAIWLVAAKWYGYRNLPLSGFAFNPAEEAALLRLLTLFRDKFAQWLLAPNSVLPVLGVATERAILGFWSVCFLSSFSVLHQQPASQSDPAAALVDGDDYRRWLQQTLYFPFAADINAIDAEKLVMARIPAYVKVALVMWLMNIPRYNASQLYRMKLHTALAAVERVSRKKPDWMDPYFHLLAEWLMTSVFRLAYIDDDHSRTVFLFGDFITSQMRRLLPEYAEFSPPPGPLFQPGRRIRVGYVSNRFTANAVTFYMANRLFHHDPATFEIQVFALGPAQDGMTEMLAKNCDRFVRLDNQGDYATMASVIRDSALDILVYADIGMGISTYLLAGMRLAPIQVALLGHASTTGLPTVDAFFSSEVEPPQAQRQYREKLFRLPNVGSSQIIPPGLKGDAVAALSREQLGIPPQAFLFVSCANGMKHIPERDFIWQEILRRAPNAWILVKPFSPGDYDRQLVERIRKAGERAGAPDRIRYIAGVDGHKGVFNLLATADVQLDTFPFNGWTTTIEAICLALPTVTQEGGGYRSRLGAGFLRAMGIEEGIAASEEEYIAWAVRFANDPALCGWVRNRIQATRKILLFDNLSLQIEYEKTLIQLCRKGE